MTTLAADSRVPAANIVVRREDDDEYVIGDPATGNFIVVDEYGARLVELFATGHTVAEAEEEIRRETGEDMDALDFAETLVEAGLIAGAAEDEAPPKNVKFWLVSRVPARFVKPLFGKVAWTFYIGCLVGVAAMYIAVPSLLPTYEDIFIVPSIVLSLLIANAVVIALTMVHEVWHAFAGAAIGVPSRLRIERRGIFPVLETDLSGLWALPPERRYGPFLAGMAIDGVVLFAVIAPRFAWSYGWIDLPPIMIRLLTMIAFSQVIKLAFQTMAYLRTDMYLVMATATGCRNLHEVTRLSIKRLFRRINHEEAAILRGAHPRDLQVARWYRMLYAVGVIWLVWFAIHFLLPTARVTLGFAGGALVGAPVGSVPWWEGLAIIAFASLNVVLPIWVVIRNRIRARRDAR